MPYAFSRSSIHVLVVGLALLSSTGQGAHAGENRLESEGGSITLVAAPAENGIVRGVLSFDLEPGWKTYWRDPGRSGIPPHVDAAATPGGGPVVLDYPAPVWLSANDEVWAGYKHSVDMPFSLDIDEARFDGTVRLDVLAGICREICIPVFGQLAVQAGGANALQTRLAVSRAQLDLPASDHAAGLAISQIDLDADRQSAVVTIDAPSPESVHVFATGLGEDGSLAVSFGQPEHLGDGRFRFDAQGAAAAMKTHVLHAVAHQPDGPSVVREIAF